MTYTTTNPLTVSYNYHQNTNHDIEKYFGKTLIPVDGDRSLIEQIEGTQMDFKLDLMPVYHNLDIDGFKDYKSRRFLVNTANNEIFDIVGKNWTPHQPREILQTFQDWVQSSCDLTLTHVGQLDGGRIVYALADYPHVIQFGDDVTIAKVLLSNFNKLGFSTKVDLFTYRIVCRNGMTVRNLENSIRLNHVNKTNISQQLSGSLNQLHKNFSVYQNTLTELTKVSLSKTEAQIMLIKEFGDSDKPINEQPQIVGTALQLFEGKGKGSEYLSAYNTAYGLLQSCTEYLNHHSRKTSTHLSSVLYGNKNNNAQKMMQSLAATYL